MRTNTVQKLDDRVFNMASTLFGFEPKQQDTPVTLPLNDRIMATYPAIIEKAFSGTMDNFRKHIATYNFETQTENEFIQKHNSEVKQFYQENTLSELQREFKRLFLQKNKKISSSRDYNKAVAEFCKNYGQIIEKKKIQSVKYATEVIFQNFLHLYNSQLMKRNEKFIKAGLTSKRPLQEFKVNSFLVTQLKRNEVNSLAICTKTVRNHRKRLEEAGVFVEYHFAGKNRAVELHINPSILVVLDVKTMELITIGNQEVSDLKGNVLPDNNDTTRTFKNEIKMNENVKNSSQEVRSSSKALTDFNFSTRTHTSKEAKQAKGAGAQSEPIKNELSKRLHELILHPQELAENLASGMYYNYKPIDIRYLYKEAFSGTLTNEEFRELAIQDFFKSISKIYRLSTPYVGSYKKAINLYYQNKWIAFTGSSFNKSVLVDELQQMRWRTNWAVKWFIKNEFPPLFPCDYLDMTRKTSKEVGFEYTKSKWNDHLRAIAKYDALKKKQQSSAGKRKQAINNAKKCETALNRFFKDKITYTHLFEYVERNLPKDYLDKLPSLILKKSLEVNGKNISINKQEQKINYELFKI
ncbi:hypothetical protein [Flavobacterium sp.]|uniref:hypothetical protein n=1 Tax=Flavobacterium sp. TaxID=239 RepID=UPI0037504BD4